MRPIAVIGVLLMLAGFGGLYGSCSSGFLADQSFQRDAESAGPRPTAPGPNAEAQDRNSDASGWQATGGVVSALALGLGALLVAVGMGNWRNPDRGRTGSSSENPLGKPNDGR
jgi:hypothetical protein